ncbi:MAG: GNAT family N-acetyltransferase [Candidatus Thorarchaeota archaeon]|nr:GNAT family N-acetyltransferase [Candidatus Thorarchaeota archaeon]
MPDRVLELESVSHRAWPAEEVSVLGGWLLRATRGVTRRANSVLPVEDPNTENLDDALSQVREFYMHRGLPVYFQMTEASKPDGLDSFLSERGLKRELVVDVQTSPIGRLSLGPIEVETRLDSEMSASWLALYGAAAHYDAAQLKVRGEIMQRVQQDKVFVTALVDGDEAGVCFGVLDGTYLGIFSLVIMEQYRRRGAATSMNRALARWAADRGAQTAYLQVEQNNAIAKRLYASLGFSTLYSYWYRTETTQLHSC